MFSCWTDWGTYHGFNRKMISSRRRYRLCITQVFTVQQQFLTWEKTSQLNKVYEYTGSCNDTMNTPDFTQESRQLKITKHEQSKPPVFFISVVLLYNVYFSEPWDRNPTHYTFPNTRILDYTITTSIIQYFLRMKQNFRIKQNFIKYQLEQLNNKYFAAVIDHARLIFPTTGHAQEGNILSPLALA